jgi:diguanylate cyclase (GGDEF)-like protein
MKRPSSFLKSEYASYILPLAVAALLLLYTQHAINELAESRVEVEHSYTVLGQLEHLRNDVEATEAAHHGYLMSEKESLLQSYYQAQKRIPGTLQGLKDLTADNAAQQERLDALSPIIHALFNQAKKDISARTPSPKQVADTMAQTKLLIDQSRVLFEQLSAEENMLLHRRTAASTAKLHRLRQWLIGLGLSFMGLLLLTYVKVQREIKARRRVENDLLESQELNQVTVHNLSLMDEMTGLLQACADTDESLDVICQFATRLLRIDSGVLYLFCESGNQVEARASWGEESRSNATFSPEDCWALRRGETHILDRTHHSLACRHLQDCAQITSVCVPIVAQGNVLGMLHLENHNHESHGEEDIGEVELGLANNLASQIALALSSINLRDTLRNLSVRDPLTGLFNRRYMEESLQREIADALRKSRPLGLVILDLDHFKEFNDTFGHDAGDLLLSEVSALLAKTSRVGDIVCRFGGEEFVIIYPEALSETVVRLTNQLREAIYALRLQHFGQSLGQISASFGIAMFGEHGNTGEELLRAADKALYQAKAAGRNCLRVAM